MAIKVGDVYGSFEIIEIDKETGTVITQCQNCKLTMSYTIDNEKQLIKILEAHDDGDDIDYNIYEGKMIGSIKIITYDEDKGYVYARCIVCNKKYELKNYPSPALIIATLRGLNCEPEKPPSEQVQMPERTWTIINRPTVGVKYKMDINSVIQERAIEAMLNSQPES